MHLSAHSYLVVLLLLPLCLLLLHIHQDIPSVLHLQRYVHLLLQQLVSLPLLLLLRLRLHQGSKERSTYV